MRAVLLVNLGTPESPSPADVGAFLKEFLSDPRVVDLARALWLPVLNLVIIPLRRRRSAKAYAKIWTDQGSPLMVNSMAIKTALQAEMGDELVVSLAMRYGKPDIAGALADLQARGVKQLAVVPMYPQFSFTTTESVFDAVRAGLTELDWRPGLALLKDYHDHPAWYEAVASSVTEFQAQNGQADKLIFSLHGIPQRFVRQGDPYQDQCRAGIKAIAKNLGLDEEDYLLTYQSRVGREPWLQPYTDATLRGLPAQGIRSVQVVCPGFSADCLETLEEIVMFNRHVFLEAGGERFDYIPALNQLPAHIAMFAGLGRAALGEIQGPV